MLGAIGPGWNTRLPGSDGSPIRAGVQPFGLSSSAKTSIAARTAATAVGTPA
jgi:hypothetical protein